MDDKKKTLVGMQCDKIVNYECFIADVDGPV